MTTTTSQATNHKSSSTNVFFAKYELPIPRFEFFLLLFLIALPFQLSLYDVFAPVARKLFPPNYPFPWCYVRFLLVYTTDALYVIALMALLFSRKIAWTRCFWEGAAKYLSCLSFITLFSLVFSKVPNFPLQYIKLGMHYLPFLLFFFVPYCFTAASFSSFMRGLAAMFCCVGSIQSAIAFAQYFTQRRLGLFWLGEEYSTVPVPSPTGQLWIFDTIFDMVRVPDVVMRPNGTLAHSNSLGIILFFTITLSYALFLEAKKKISKIIIIAAILLQTGALFITFSRGALLTFPIVMLIWVWMMRHQLFKISAASLKQKLKKLIDHPVIITFFVTTFTSFVLFYPALIGRGFIYNNPIVQQSLNERLGNQEVSLNMIAANPILGVGYDCFQIAKSKYDRFPGSKDYQSPVHNVYLLLASEGGLLALAFYLLFIGAVLKRAFKIAATPIHAALTATFCGFLFISNLEFAFYLINNLSFLFFAIAALLVTPSIIKDRTQELKLPTALPDPTL